MTTFTIKRQKLFFDYGLTTAEIQSYAKANNTSVKDAYSALKNQRANAGVGKEAYAKLDPSRYKAKDLRAVKELNTGIVGKSPGGAYQTTSGKLSASAAGQASAKYNKAFLAGQKSVVAAPTTTGGYLKGAWNSMSKTGKAGAIAGGLALGGLAVKGLVGGNKKEKTYSVKRITK